MGTRKATVEVVPGPALPRPTEPPPRPARHSPRGNHHARNGTALAPELLGRRRDMAAFSVEPLLEGEKIVEVIDRKLDDRLRVVEREALDRLSQLEQQLKQALTDARWEERVQEKEQEVRSRVDRLTEELRGTLSSQPVPDKKRRLRFFDGVASLVRKGARVNWWTSLRQVLREIRMIGRSEEVDEFGMDPVFEELVMPVLDFFYHRWWRIESNGVKNIPSEGRGLLVSNHSGTLPFDGAMTKLAVRKEHPAKREVRFLVEDFVFYFPFLSSAIMRFGGVRACQENAQRLLDHDQLVAVYPEGVKGLGKYYKHRYQLARFGRGGFITLCMRSRSPVVPVAVVGAEETAPIIAKSTFLAKLFRVPYFPITVTFPWLGLLGLVPLPTKWTIDFGEPLDVTDRGRASLSDDLFINRQSERVRSAIHNMMIYRLQRRKSIFFG